MEIAQNSSPFVFEGIIPASKSSYNRAMIIKSFEPRITVVGEGQCDDIVKMRMAIIHLGHHESVFDCGQAGTVLRFLALRLSREQGTFLLTGWPRLFKRPQTELARLFAQLGINYQMVEKGMKIESQGWQIPDKPLKVSGRESSQFLSGLLLNAWKLPKEMQVEIPQDLVSADYFHLTMDIMKGFGFQWREENGLFIVPPHQVPMPLTFKVESDVSSAFAVAALATVRGRAKIKQFPFETGQPDIAFVDILNRMGGKIERCDEDLSVEKVTFLKGAEVNLNSCPDLFPVLCALAALAQGTTRLLGAPHLRFKESNRIQEVVTLLRRLGVNAEECEDGAIIEGTQDRNTGDVFLNTMDDHRLVMMAAVLKAGGFKIRIENAESVTKSFPEFLTIAKGYL